jgi:flagellar hook-associated protein 1 FlgK
MGSDVLGISISGLRVSQNAIRTTGHNIANANTEGYSRQSTQINSMGGQQSGIGYLGSGSFVSGIERVVNDFVVEQLRQDTSLYNELNSYNENIIQLNDLLANTSTGLTVGLESFFAAVQNVTDDPTSVTSRQLFISESENLADRFNTLYTRTSNINDGVKQNIESSVETINALASSIARLNLSISDSFGKTDANSPNDLLDQRDEALRKLSEIVSIQITEQNNQVNVSIGAGVPLVVGVATNTLSLGQNEFDPVQPEIYLSGLTRPITDSMQGGELGGLLDFQDGVISNTLNDLGRIGIVLADSFNALQQQGITLNNTFGQDLFFDINRDEIATSRVRPSSNNTTSDQIVSLSITDTSQLTTSDYRFSIDTATNVYRVTRLEDNVDLVSNIMPPVFPASITFDGLSFNITSGTFSGGDEFLIRPTRSGANDFSANRMQASDIALGSPLLTNSDLGNLGGAEISSGQVLSLVDSSGTDLPLFSQPGTMSPPLLVQFTTPTTYDVLDNSNPGNPVQLNPPIRNQVYVPGIENNLFSDDMGETRVVSTGASLGLPATRASLTVNEYPAETLTFTITDPDTGASTTQTVNTTLNASARTTAGLIDNMTGVNATAFNYLEMRSFSLDAPASANLQISLNGENLVEYDGGAIAATVPSPGLNSGEDFNDYLVDQINNNVNLTNLGIYAVSAYDAATSEFYIQVHSTRGDDLSVQLAGAGTDEINISDGNNPAITLDAGTATTQVLVGGSIDVTLDSNISMSTTPATSAIFGNSGAANFAQSSYLGIQASITGSPAATDRFTLDFNQDAAQDNRNGLLMAGLQLEGTIGGNTETFNTSYNRLIEGIGIQTSTSQIDTEAAKNVLDQSKGLRESISGVNLDEEAADLIRYEQLYSANAQVINVARQLFDQLLNSF